MCDILMIFMTNGYPKKFPMEKQKNVLEKI